MCGIAGIWTRGTTDRSEAALIATARHMADTLAHRGPDDAGVWADCEAGIALAHRRLSIIDPSPAGHQPMPSPCGRYILSYNGEIYNHRALRAELEATGRIAWQGHSDTETLVHAITRWGLHATLQRTVGMFALASWDRQARILSLARDRIGEKPLYYGWSGDALLFGSELKAIRAAPGFAGRVDPAVLALYLRHNCIPAPWSIFTGFYKVEPGTIVAIDHAGLSEPAGTPPTPDGPASPGLRCERYWSLDAVIAKGIDPAMTGDHAVDALHARLRDAVSLQRVADTPLGAFLSGGIDSSTIVALMQDVATAPVRTFTIGFAESDFDEAPHARAVARHLGTDHTELYVDADTVRAVIPDLPQLYDEPFADSSQLPTVLLSRLARGAVTVALSGDGADELFCGYNRYLVSRRLWDAAAALPAPVRRGAGRMIEHFAPHRWDALAALPGVPAVPMLGDKMHKAARMLRTSLDTAAIYRGSSEHWQGGVPVRGHRDAGHGLPDTARDTPEEQMMQWDMTSYLPDDILTKVDRAGMAVGLETRMPFLDHRVVEQAWRTPLAFKKRGGESKWALRRILYRYVPAALVDRPKAGFAIPLGIWLRGPLAEWADTLLAPDDALLDMPPIRVRWAQHRAGTHDWTASLWGVLMYRAWVASC